MNLYFYGKFPATGKKSLTQGKSSMLTPAKFINWYVTPVSSLTSAMTSYDIFDLTE